MEILTVGDLVKNFAVTTLHSRFERVINYNSVNDIVVSIVSRDVKGGPNNIVIDLPYVPDSVLPVIDENKLIFGCQTFPLERCKVFVSELKTQKNSFRSEEILERLAVVEEVVKSLASPLSCAFLLGRKSEDSLKSKFGRCVKDAISVNFERFLNGDLSAASDLKGIGFGLTPQGDDLIRGSLVAILIYEKASNCDLSTLRERIYDFAKGGNALVNTFLYFASRGRLYEKEKDLLGEILDHGSALVEKTKLVLDQGETSGADFLTGMVLTGRKLLIGGNIWQ